MPSESSETEVSASMIDFLKNNIYYCCMQVVTLSGSHGQILWGKSSCRFHILQLMIPMDPYPCFLIIYLQYLPVLDKLIKMKLQRSRDSCLGCF
ncbi:putative Rop guanine nucleotide exchange factor [Helianthus annuus]|nr:putative Rop guanine nucleotide exchange factor [Helianthus annuus]